MTALLTAESRGTTGPTKNEKLAQAVAECKRLEVPVLPPNINSSEADFTIEGLIVKVGDFASTILSIEPTFKMTLRSLV